MNDFEGRNLPQLLDLLHGVVTPEPVSWFAHTPGWWIVGAWLLVMSLLGVWHAYRKWRRNRYRRAALTELKAMALHTRKDPAAAQSVAALLKRTALVAYPRSQVAHLYGREWAGFLCESAHQDTVVTADADRLAAMAYRPVDNLSELIKPARRWIEVHGD